MGKKMVCAVWLVGVLLMAVLCFGAKGGGGVSVAKTVKAYNTYFRNNPRIMAVSLDVFSADEMDYFWQDLASLEAGRRVVVAAPENFTWCVSGCRFVYLTDDEASRVWAAKVAHSIWLDKNRMVSWRLSGYSDADLHFLLDKGRAFDGFFDGKYRFEDVVDYSPSEGYDVMRGFVKASASETVMAFVEDLRKDFRHGLSMSSDPVDFAFSFKDVMTTYYSGRRGSVHGCQSMTSVVARGLDALNIPAYKSTLYYDGGGHASTIIPGAGLVLNHGDDIYSTGLKSTPVDSLLMPWDYFESEVLSCNGGAACEKYSTRRYGSLNVMNYPSEYSVSNCCNPFPTYDSCDEFFVNGLGLYGVSQEEVDSFKTGLLGMCQG